jgi:hypothetical protein
VVILPPITGATEEYDGTTWTTSPGSLNTARLALAGAGTQTAALAFGGDLPPIQQQQKNMTVLLGQVLQVCLQQDIFRRSRNTTSSFSFWW